MVENKENVSVVCMNQMNVLAGKARCVTMCVGRLPRSVLATVLDSLLKRQEPRQIPSHQQPLSPLHPFCSNPLTIQFLSHPPETPRCPPKEATSEATLTQTAIFPGKMPRPSG
jgi:hypothetical protein